MKQTLTIYAAGGPLVALALSSVMRAAVCFGLLLEAGIATAFTLPPSTKPTLPLLDYWSFSDTNTWASQYGYAPVSFTNLSASTLGDGTAVVVDSADPAWLQCNVFENDGTTNLTVDTGGLTFWFAPNWSSTNEDGGTGPGAWSRLIEVGANTPDASYGWWSLYVDPEGANLYFSAQDNQGNEITYLTAPIDWTTNRWHMIGLSYCATGSALYVDGVAVTNGLAVTLWPSLGVLTNGFCLCSDGQGLNQAHGMFDDLHTYTSPLDSSRVGLSFKVMGAPYYANPLNSANLSQAPSSPQITPTFEAVTGPGYLQNLGSVSGCVVSSNVWFTNVVATMATNGTMNLSFSIIGGWNNQNGPFDVFANTLLGPTNNPACQWVWMGQGYSCNRYMLTNLPSSSVYLILGTPQDSDQDGLTDAYELLVSHTNPQVKDSSGDGMLDGWKVLWGLNTSTNNVAQPGLRATYSYTLTDWLSGISGIRAETIGSDFEGNITGN